jgi:hypothetical protein
MSFGFFLILRYDLSDDRGVNGRIILKLILKNRLGDMYWIDLGENRDRWRAVVNAAMNLRVP